jgi:hypothetical protein
MNDSGLQSLTLVLGLIAMLGPLLAGIFLAVRLNRRHHNPITPRD